MLQRPKNFIENRGQMLQRSDISKKSLKKAGQHTPPRRSHTVIPLPAFVQSGIVFSVCGLSIQTRSAPFRTTPEWTAPFPKPGIDKALHFRQKHLHSFFCKQRWKPEAQRSALPILQRTHSIAPRKYSFCITAFGSGRWSAEYCFPAFERSG